MTVVVRAAHSAYYLDALYQRKADLEGANQVATLHDITVDMENVRLARLRAATHRHYGALVQASHSLFLFYRIRGDYVDGESMFSAAAASLRAAPPDPARDAALGHLLLRQADLALELFQREKGDRLLTESRTLIEPMGDPWLRALSLYVEGSRLPFEETATARAPLQKALALFRQLGDQWQTVRCLLFLGYHCAGGMYTDRVDTEQARRLLQEAAAICTITGDIWGLGMALNCLGVAASTTREYPMALAMYQESLALRRRLSDLQASNTMVNITISLVAMGRLNEAVQCLEEALAMKRALGMNDHFPGFDDHSELYIRLGDSPEARRCVIEGLTQAEQTEQYRFINIFRLWVIRLDWIEGDYASGAKRLKDWLAFAAADPDNPAKQHDLVFALAMGCYLEMARDGLAEAHAYHIRLVSEAERLAHRQGQMVGKIIAGQLALADGGSLFEAREDLETVLSFFDNESFMDMSTGWEIVFPTAQALATFSRIAGVEGDFGSAYGYIDRALRHARDLSIPAFALMALTALAELLA